MGLFDSMKKQLGNAAGTARKAAENLPDSVKEIDAEKTLKGFRKMGGDAFLKFKNESADLYGRARESLGKKEATSYIREQDALIIMYYLIASDMHVEDEEMDMFNSIGLELDPQFESYKDMLVNRCNAQIRGITDPDEYYDIVHEQVNSIIYNSQHSGEGSVQPGVLLWNLISIAFSEGEYSANEKRLIRSVGRSLEIDAIVIKEMEQAIQTLLALTEEEKVLKTSNRKYSEVEVYINEIADRKQTIMQNVRALMLD